jgi:hypothetical protein
VTFLAASLENWRYVAAKGNGLAFNQVASPAGWPSKVAKVKQKYRQ